MWIVKVAFLFLLVWGLWYVCWTVLFAAWDIGNGFAPLPVTIGAIASLFVAAKIVEYRKKKKASSNVRRTI